MSKRWKYLELGYVPGLALGFYQFDEYPALHIRCMLDLWLTLPMIFHRPKLANDFQTLFYSWGISWDWRHNDNVPRNAIHVSWGKHYKIIHMPWDWEHIRCDVLLSDGTWCRCEDWERPDNIFQEKHEYTYVRKNGEVQTVVATIGVEEREWRWRWLKRFPYPRLIHRSITVRFSDEIGERTGSWKGGCIGCGYDMLEGETPKETLKRMEKNRIFD